MIFPPAAIFLMYFMMATSLSVMSSTLIVKFHYGTMGRRPPLWLRRLTLDFAAPILCLQDAKDFYRRHAACCHLVAGECQSRVEQSLMQNNGDCCNEPYFTRTLADGDKDTLSRTLSLDCVHPRAAMALSRDYEPVDKRKMPLQPCQMDSEEFLHAEWKRISQVLDRLFFWLFLMFMLMPLASLIWLTRAFRSQNQDYK